MVTHRKRFTVLQHGHFATFAPGRWVVYDPAGIATVRHYRTRTEARHAARALDEEMSR